MQQSYFFFPVAGSFGKKQTNKQIKQNSFEYLLIATAELKGWGLGGGSKCRVIGFNWDVGVDVRMEHEQRFFWDKTILHNGLRPVPSEPI